MTTSDICPACGARNDCSMANPETVAQPCWCYGVSIDPEVLRALLNRKAEVYDVSAPELPTTFRAR